MIFCIYFLIGRVVKFKIKKIKQAIIWNGGSNHKRHLLIKSNNIYSISFLLEEGATERWPVHLANGTWILIARNHHRFFISFSPVSVSSKAASRLLLLGNESTWHASTHQQLRLPDLPRNPAHLLAGAWHPHAWLPLLFIRWLLQADQPNQLITQAASSF